MHRERNRLCYELLMQVFRDNAYASVALNAALSDCDPKDKAYVTRLFYGVLERNVYYEYVLARFAEEKPKKSVATLVKMGYYLLERTSIPPYAAVNATVALCKQVGKSGAAGFVNAALRAFAPPPLPREDTAEYLSVVYSYPLWLCELLIADHGYEFTKSMLSHVPEHRTHIRVNAASITPEAFENAYCRGHMPEDGASGAQAITPTPFGYYVPRKLLENIPDALYAVQSVASIAAVYAYIYGLPPIREALDLCAAPGGKAVLLALKTGANVTACDIHAHRVEMIRKYAFRCDARVSAQRNDATVLRADWERKFDLVVCDVPCSGIGVAGSKPDVLFNRSEADIDSLAEVQAKILETAARYVKTGGRLCYSTCTVLKRENTDVVRAFLRRHPEFSPVKGTTPRGGAEREEICLFPHVDGTDGFYVAVLTKNRE